MSHHAGHARFGLLVLLMAFCVSAAGCGKNKVTQENYDKIEAGMSLHEVERILGNGTQVGGDGGLVAAQVGVDVGSGAKQSSTLEYIWEGGKGSITVAFRQDKMIQKRKAGF